MKAICIIIAVILVIWAASEILSLMAILAGGIGFLSLIVKEAMNR